MSAGVPLGTPTCALLVLDVIAEPARTGNSLTQLLTKSAAHATRFPAICLPTPWFASIRDDRLTALTDRAALAALRRAVTRCRAPLHASVFTKRASLALAEWAMVGLRMTPRLAADEVVIIVIVRCALRLASWAALALALLAVVLTGAPALTILVLNVVLICWRAGLADRASTAFAVIAVLTNAAPVFTRLEDSITLDARGAVLAHGTSATLAELTLIRIPEECRR